MDGMHAASEMRRFMENSRGTTKFHSEFYLGGGGIRRVQSDAAARFLPEERPIHTRTVPLLSRALYTAHTFGVPALQSAVPLDLIS